MLPQEDILFKATIQFQVYSILLLSLWSAEWWRTNNAALLLLRMALHESFIFYTATILYNSERHSWLKFIILSNLSWSTLKVCVGLKKPVTMFPPVCKTYYAMPCEYDKTNQAYFLQ